MKQKFIILTIILFSGFVLFLSLLAERYFKLLTIEIRKETLIKEKVISMKSMKNLLRTKQQNNQAGVHSVEYPFVKSIVH